MQNPKSVPFIKKSFLILAGVLTASSVLIALLLAKVLCPNKLFADAYEVRGVDVSHYQGNIDWKTLEREGISFAFIKATEGSSYIDECFIDNWQASAQTDLFIGAYHFFSFDSPARTQAELYIETVGDLSGRLVPAVDVEYYGDKERNPPDRDFVISQLQEMLLILEEYYQVKPVIYTTYKVYHRYIKDAFEDYPLWIRNVYYTPDIDMQGKWTFWQYSDRMILRGYSGVEKYIDLNVFHGSLEDLKTYVIDSMN